MSVGQYLMTVVFVGLIGAGGAREGAQKSSEEPMLLVRATRIASVKGAGLEYSDCCVWLSDHEVISVDYPGNWRQPPIIAFHDLATGGTRKIAFTRWTVGTHTQVTCSADGRWALCLNADGPQPGDRVVAMDLQTGRTLSWPSLGDPYHLPNHWLSDSRRWLQYPTLEDSYFNVYSVDAPTKTVRLAFPDASFGCEEANWRTHGHCFTNNDHLLIYNDPGIRDEDWMKLDIREYRLFPSMTLLNRRHFYPPHGQKLRAICFSPSGDRIAWVTADSALWVSRSDGKNPVEIGRMPDLVDWGRVPYLTWLPGGKRLSFVYEDNLYTVPIPLDSALAWNTDGSR